MKEYVEALGFKFKCDVEIEEIEEIGTCPYAYYRMRGRKITPLQAFEILSDIDRVCYCLFLVNSFVFSRKQDIVRPDGYVGFNHFLFERRFRIDEIVHDLAILKKVYPYLDLVIAFTDDSYKNFIHIIHEMEFPLQEFCIKDFEERIICGIHVHDDVIHVLNAENARVKYREYNMKYGCPNEYVFSMEYYDSGRKFCHDSYYKQLVANNDDEGSEDESEKTELITYTCPLITDNLYDLSLEMSFIQKMVVLYRYLKEPEKFKAWIISQYLYDAQEQGYSIDTAWNMMVNSKAGASYLRGTSSDLSFSEVESEVGHLYEKEDIHMLRGVTDMIEDIQKLLDILDKYEIDYGAAFKYVCYEDFCHALIFEDSISETELYELLVGKISIEKLIPYN